jgi:hypothetical protein
VTELGRIRGALRWVRRAQARRRALAAGEATLWISVVVVASSALVLGLYYGRTLQLGLLAAWGGLLAAYWLGRVAVPLLRSRRDEDTARMLEAHARELRSDLTGALQFGGALGGGSAEEAARLGSPALMRAHVEHVARRVVGRLPTIERQLPSHRPARLRVAALAVASCFAVLLLAAPQVAQTGLRRLFLGAPPEPVMAAGAVAEQPAQPLVAGIRVTYRFPGYTGREPVRIDNPTGRIEVLAGTEVTLRAQALRPLARASLVMASEAAAGTAPASPEAQAEGGAADDAAAAGEGAGAGTQTAIDLSVAGSLLEVVFTPMQDATYHFAGVTTEGRALRDPVERHIVVIPDAPPQVELMAPSESVVSASADEVVAFRFTASDDFGLTELAFVHALLGDDGDEQRDVLLSLDDNLAFQDAAGFDLTPLRLQPRDELLVYLEAVDNDTIAGPKPGRSRPVRIRIAAPEDRHLETIAREEQLFEALLTVLGDYLENPIGVLTRTAGETTYAVPVLSPGEYGDIYHAADRINDSVLEMLHAMQSLLDFMEEDAMLLSAHYERFSSMHARLDELRREAHAVLTSMGRPAARGQLGHTHMVRLDDVRQRQEQATEQAILEIEELIAEQRMESLVRTLEELDEIQERLRDALERYRDTEDPAIREEIERELARLEARMRELLQRLAEQMQEVPREHYNVEALEEMGMMQDVGQMSDALQQIRDMLEQGDIEGALQALQDLETQISDMMSQMSQSLQSGGSGVSELDQRIAELMDEVNDLAAQEAALEEETAALQEEIRRRRTEEVEAQMAEFVEDARRRVAEMREALEGVEGERLRRDITEDLERAEGALSALDEELAEGDVASALENADGLMGELNSAGDALERMNRPGRTADGAYREAGETVQQVQETAQGLSRDLERLIEQARPVPGEGDVPAMQGLAQRQGETAQRLSELRERIRQMGGEMPMIEQELGPALEGVGQRMQQAQGRLGQGMLQPGLESEREAMEGLESMRQQMHQMVARERMGQRASGNISQERVEIPAEPDETPEEFRRDILDAMRDESIRAYQEANRAYYESLVR